MLLPAAPFTGVRLHRNGAFAAFYGFEKGYHCRMDCLSVRSRFNKKATLIVSWFIIISSLLIGFATRIVALARYVDFDGDQTYSAAVFAGMWNNLWPTLGPPISGSAFSIPPLFYYIYFPFTIFGMDPTWQAFPNALLSFFSIPLVIIAVYRLLAGKDHASRLFFASIGGLWWSLLLIDIIHAVRNWNPSAIPFFILLFVLIAAGRLRRPAYYEGSVVAWAALGAISAVLVSLHALMLYAMPPVFLIIAVAYISRCRSRIKATAVVLFSLFVAGVCLTPYWIGEAKTDWRNTHAIVDFVSNQAGEHTTLLDKISNIAKAYAWLDGQYYFIGSSRFVRQIGLVFLVIIVITAFTSFRGDRALLGVLSCIWLTFFLEASSNPMMQARYLLPIALAPLFLAISSLAFLNYQSWKNRVIGGFIAVGLALSIADNGWMDILHELRVISSNRVVAVSDVISAFRIIPDQATICDLRLADVESDRYIDTYVTKRHLHFSDSCIPGSYGIAPKFLGGDGYGMGADFALTSFDVNNYDRYYSYVGVVAGPPLPSNARIISQSEALTIFAIDEKK